MPVLEFALDATTQYRVQVHLNVHQGPVSVMLNRSVLGSLVTTEEQSSGKDFRLPDHTLLRVSVNNGQAQVWRDGQPLLLTSTSGALPPLERQEGRMGGGVTALFVLNVVAVGVLVLSFWLQAFMVTSSSDQFLPLLLLGLIGLPGLAGLFVLLAWKKWGFYFAACYGLANLTLAIVYSIVDYRAFIPLVGLVLLYSSLRSSGIWRKMS